MSSNIMRQREERHVPSHVEMMVWCSCLDLLALSNTRGEVQLHRLNWHRVWSLAPPMETSLVRGIAWRPDGKVLAIGYSCGRVCLVDVEDKEILFMSKSGAEMTPNRGGVTCVSWKQKYRNKNLPPAYGNSDDANIYLPQPPIINSNYKKSEKSTAEIKRNKEQTDLNVLLVGYEYGEIHISVFGQFPCGILDLKNYILSDDIKIMDVQLSSDFTTMQVFVENNKDNNLNLVLLNTEALAAYSEELHALASKHDHIVGVISYIDQTMTSIIEAWEQILLEMDSKLEKYACNVVEGGVSADFLDLLILGVPSAELEIFLLQDLTAKGLKKFGTSIELSYSTIQKLVLKQLNTVGHNLTYHLSELRGLARIKHRYKILGLEEETVDQAILSSSAFINKCLELQQVIEHSMKNYKAFFRWLFVVIVRLMDEHVPSDISKINQQDLTYIAEFLQNFDKVGVERGPSTSKEALSTDNTEKKTGKFNLERLGQYLVNKELTIMTEDENNPWIKFLNENPCLMNSGCIIPNFKKFSLIQQQMHLKNSIQALFNRSEKSFTSYFKLFETMTCFTANFADDNLRLSQINDTQEHSVLIVFTDTVSSERGFYFMEILFRDEVLITKCCYFYFHASGSMNDSKLDSLAGHNLNVVDIQFYSTEIVSVLLEKVNDDEVSVFVQFPVELCKKYCKVIEISEKGQAMDSIKNTSRFNAFAILEKGTYNILDKMSAKRLAVSGSRKVVVVLSKTSRKVRLFEMEADGEDDDDDSLDTTQQSLSSTQHSDPSHYNSLNETGVMQFAVNNTSDESQLSESIE